MLGRLTAMSDAERRVATVRSFNRFYTPRIGLLGGGYLDSTFSVTEVRVLYELAHRDGSTAAEIAGDLELDAGYLSRLLRGFAKLGLVERRPSATDRRRTHLWLTERGREAFAPLDARSHDEIAGMLGQLSVPDQDRVVRAMDTVQRLLGGGPAPAEPYLLRTHQPGDMGWVVHRHGVLYANEFGWDERFEALVAGIVARFIERFDPRRERCWIAERDHEIVGSVFLVKRSQTVAQLRLLLVEPDARGLGIGARLVEECIRFARQAGYRRIRLWTNDVLHGARRVYERAGFRLVSEQAHHSFGHDLVGQTWELKLS
ncbi:MAG: bifunctional helix-turn-helix transcriptional regulator/GNAT family N-acetyltransferase [Candidatus Limnocylindria bacterium]